MTKNDVAIYLDLDNLAIGAKQANLPFDIDRVLDCIEKRTNGRIVLRRSYGDWRQNQKVLEAITKAGFRNQSTVRLNNLSKNLADMQIVVDAMETLVDGREYSIYVLITGDRDFTPLVQTLQKRGKRVIGVGLDHTASKSLVSLCDEYIFYEDIVPAPKLTKSQIEQLLHKAIDDLLANDTDRIEASRVMQTMLDLSNGRFDRSQYGGGSFRKFLQRFPDLLQVEQVESTTYVSRAQSKQPPARALHLRYRSQLKKQRLRVIPPQARFVILNDLIAALREHESLRWRQLIDQLSKEYKAKDQEISKNQINAIMLVARQAEVIRTLKGRSLSTAPVLLLLKGDKIFKEAIMSCDDVYLRAILDLEEPFDVEEAAIALYENAAQVPYLKQLMNKWG